MLKYKKSMDTLSLVHEVLKALNERDELERYIEYYKTAATQDSTTNLNKEFLRVGREKVFKDSWSKYDDGSVKNYKGEVKTLEEYANDCIVTIPDWMCKEQFVTTFASEIQRRYDRAISEMEKEDA